MDIGFMLLSLFLGFLFGCGFADLVGNYNTKYDIPPLSQPSPSLNGWENPPVGSGTTLIEGKTVVEVLRKQMKMLEIQNAKLERECGELKNKLQSNRYADLAMLFKRLSFTTRIKGNTLVDDYGKVVIEESKSIEVWGVDKCYTVWEYHINENYKLNTKDRELLNEAVTDFRSELQHFIVRDS